MKSSTKPFVIITAAAALAALTGCSTATPEPAATVTVTAAAPSASASADPRTAESPIDSFDAYYYCVSKVYEFAAGSDEDPFELAAYADAEITEADGGYKVQLQGAGDDLDSVYCVVNGTVGNPSIDDYLYPR
jgi:ABC-type transport system substrate-binding protein